MSLIRQLWLLLLATVVAGVVGSTLVTVNAARDTLETQLRLKNSDNAQALALTLSQQRGDAALLELAVAAQFDTGFYERIALRAADGSALVERRAEPRPPEAPAWFVHALPIASPPGVAQVSDGWKPIGSLEVVSAAGFAHADLWRGSLRSAGWLALVGLLTGLLAALVLGRIRAPLHDTVEQARALVERRFVMLREPKVPELRQLSQAMNTMVERLRTVFGEQGAQLEAMRRQAQADPLTGLANRSHFMNRLAGALGREDTASSGALLLVRVRELAGLNRALGHAQTDALLRGLAEVLRARCEAQPLAEAGRLNGSDFAVLVAGADAATLGAELAAALRNALAGVPQAQLGIGAVGWQAASEVGPLLQRADAALVRAEAQDGHGLAIEAPADAPPALGEEAWRARLQQALARGDAELGAFPLLDRGGALLHLECPLRLRLQAGAAPQAAAHWLPWARRTGLTAEADRTAVALALAQCRADGRPRGVNLAPDSLADGGFVAGLRALLQGQPEAARLLSLDVAERAAVERLPLVRELARQLQPLGVRLGLEHAGERLARIDRLYEAGLDYVKLDAAQTLDLHADARRQDFVRSLVSMLHGLGMQVHAEGVRSAEDARALWDCGIDGQTGPWVSRAAAAG